mmetsp:Transcript_28540/g.37344  ORF Transcript_28540/g.37344 Transcript_28540/m.37344 type:complete len:863 (+) Transcript_28540:35-2623(+)
MMRETSDRFPTSPSSAAAGRESVLYFQPEAIPIRFSLQSFPQSATVKNNSGLPWSVCLTPFMNSDLICCNTDCIPVKLIARCNNCFAYINPFCELRGRYWKCSLCFEVNPIKKDQKRYRRADADERLPELMEQVVEYELPLETKGTATRAAGSAGPQWGASGDDDDLVTAVPSSLCPPVVLALVDETGSEPYKLAVVKALKSALTEMPDEVCFGLFTFSSRLGFFDLSSDKPNIQCMPLGDVEETVSLMSDMVCFEETVFPLGKFRDKAIAAVESLTHSFFWVSELTDADEPYRKFGAAISALYSLVAEQEEYEGPSFTPAGVRIGIFLSGRPNSGPGTITVTFDANQKDSGERPLVVDKSAEAFYTKLSSEGARQGICFHLFAVVTPTEKKYIGLQTLLPLAHLSGGQATLYEVGQQTGAQPGCEKLRLTVTAALGYNVAHNCLLRVRTSPEFRPSRTNQFGHWTANSELVDLWHAGACGEDSCLCLDLEYSSPGGFTMDDQSGPMVQVAFAYTTVQYVNSRSGKLIQRQSSDRHLEEHGESDSASGLPSEDLLVPVTVRRLRVLTVQADYSTELEDIYNQCDVPTISAVILYKVMAECQASNVAEARVLLSDWLVRFYTNFYQHQRIKNPDIELTSQTLLDDKMFSTLIRAIYGMLHMELLMLSDISSDQRASQISSFMSIEPSCVQYAVYPGLQAFKSAERRIAKNLPLSRKSIIGSGGKIFILDAFWTIIVYFAVPLNKKDLASLASKEATIPSDIPSSNDKDDSQNKEDANSLASSNDKEEELMFQSTGLVESFLKKRMKIRTVWPEVIRCSVGSKDAYFFDLYLLDDKELPDSKVTLDGFVNALINQLQESTQVEA